MSILFGILKPEGDVVGQEELERFAEATQHLAPDGTFLHRKANIGLGFQPFHTTDRSRRDHPPRIDGRQNVVLLDGRLDNHEELRSQLGIPHGDISDGDLILSSFAFWGENCFAMFRGEWAMSLWVQESRRLYLARDHAGTRQLYFARHGREIAWSTTLHALVGYKSGPKISRPFAVRFLSGQTTWHLTPFEEIEPVPAAHFAVFSGESVRSILHWCPTPGESFPIRASAEYDQRFLELFRIAIERRINSGAGILAELSGGMDSSAIVCVADQIRNRLSQPVIDTISFFDDSEPHWNERPYFTEMERKRGHTGIHIDVSETHRRLDLQGGTPETLLSPAVDCGRAQLENMIRKQLGPSPHRVVLSGFAGDELLGGVPAPVPELVELFAAGRLSALVARGTEWSIRARTPLLHLLWRTLRTVAEYYRRPRGSLAPPWIRPGVMRLCETPFSWETFMPCKVRKGGPRSMMRWELWWSVIDLLPHSIASSRLHLEYRYPYLDRDLVEFLLSVPRHELCAPGRRRAMMRRALQEIVPAKILDRPRKAYISRLPLALIRESSVEIEELFADSRMAEYGLLEPADLRICLASAIKGETRWVRMLLATIAYEVWLRNLDGEWGKRLFPTSNAVPRLPCSVPARTAAGGHG